jgi:flavin reductase (DIM6/NTAB) family NADH-FMN oxidoreductase RutF
MEPKLYNHLGREMTIIDKVMDNILQGVSIITTQTNGKLNGMAASWVSRVAEQPFLVMASIWHNNYSNELIKKSKIFAVNILAAGQKDVAKHFGLKSGRKVDKFQDILYESKKTGSPILKDCLGYLDCKLFSLTEAGDHTLFVGEVVDAGFQKKAEPLVNNRIDFPYLTAEELRRLKG